VVQLKENLWGRWTEKLTEWWMVPRTGMMIGMEQRKESLKERTKETPTERLMVRPLLREFRRFA
jgi:hypothetical protein